MPFNTALSGIRAASSELSVTGNNIANASTTGFKESRVEFGDVYATSVLGAGASSAGSGVQIQDIAQSFSQGNVTFTENELDLAINGSGFFILNQDGETLYTRAGSFGLDSDGFVINNSGARLQGFVADESGNLSGIPSDIQLETTDLDPRRTTLVESRLNLDATEDVLARTGRAFSNLAAVAVGSPVTGLSSAETSSITGDTFTVSAATPLGIDFGAASIQFDLTMANATVGNNTVSVTLNTANGVPQPVDSKRDLEVMVASINEQLLTNVPSVSAVASVVDLGSDNYQIAFTALQGGEASSISYAAVTANEALIGMDTVTSVTGEAAVSNGYPADSLLITDAEGNSTPFNAALNASAAETAAELNALEGVTATAQTEVTLSNLAAAGAVTITLNGVGMAISNLSALGDEINARTNTTLPGVTATFDGAALNIISASGEDISVSIGDGADGDLLSVAGVAGSTGSVLEIDSANDGVAGSSFNATTNSVIVGGTMEIVLDENYTVSDPGQGGIGIFPLIIDADGSGFFTEQTINAFDASDQSTYNSATSMTIFDSLGVDHVMTQYFVKEGYDPGQPVSTTNAPNRWTMYVQIDGQNVGDPIAPSIVPTQASFSVRFNEDGSLDTGNTPDIQITNWVPLDSEGNPNNADGPNNNGILPIPNPPASSNFVIDLNGTSQFGSAFSVRDIDQNGFTTGQLSGLNIDDEGVIFARFTNGESLVLSQVLLADFANQNGLQPMGNTMWAETFESGEPVPNIAGQGALGTIQAGALEESNVDLSEQLVALIIAQRNFQASAKTIETADSVTQTIINLR